MELRDRLIVALDVDTAQKAIDLAGKLKDDVGLFKVGFELFSSCGPAIVKELASLGGRVFLDLKFHDIPNTVSKAALSVMKPGVFMFNVHGLGGYEMMKKASDAVKARAQKLGIAAPKVLAVTVLTSMDEIALKKVGINDTMDQEVLRLAELAYSAGLDGVVASPSEARIIRQKLGENFLIVTPGVRPAWAEAGDQKRIATPKEALAGGATYIVVGRPITEASDPARAAKKILEELSA